MIISVLSHQLFFLHDISSSSVRQLQFFFAKQNTVRRFLSFLFFFFFFSFFFLGGGGGANFPFLGFFHVLAEAITLNLDYYPHIISCNYGTITEYYNRFTETL